MEDDDFNGSIVEDVIDLNPFGFDELYQEVDSKKKSN